LRSGSADDEAKPGVELVELPEVTVPFVPRAVLEIAPHVSHDAFDDRGVHTCES